MANLSGGNPLLMCDWEECLNQIALAEPETEPGREQFYHYLSYGWLCGGIIENASQKNFQEILEEAIVKPLKIDGELYVGIPPGVESRLASLTLDTNDLSKLAQTTNRPDLPSTFQPDRVGTLLTTLPALFNMLITRRAIIPAANGHCSARALARYYATLVDGGVIPPPHSSSSKPPLGSHPHTPKLASLKHPKQKAKKRGEVVAPSNKKQDDDDDNCSDDENKEGDSSRNTNGHTYSKLANDESTSRTELRENGTSRVYTNPRIHEAFMGTGEEYGGLALPSGAFGLGFRRLRSNGSIVGFGHSGMGGSTGFCFPKERFAIAVTVNKMSLGYGTRRIMQLVCSELNMPLPEEFSLPVGGDGEIESGKAAPLIN